MMTKKWVVKPNPEKNLVEKLAGTLNIHQSIASLLVQRGIYTFDQAKTYFRPSLVELHNPFVMKGMDTAVLVLLDALKTEKAILVYGDYDVDGVTAVAVFYQFLKTIYKNVHFYIPDRHLEGYGVSMKAINIAAKFGIKLIISLDCGIGAIEPIKYAKSLGIDFIVCDHHEPGRELPDANAILDPKQEDCLYPDKNLSGCGVGFKLVQALLLQLDLQKSIAYNYLDLVALSIACDIVPIIGENRILAYHGLIKLNNNPNLGLKTLIENCKLTIPLDISDLVFSIGPRINAAGRIDHADVALKLLLSKDQTKINELAQSIEKNNCIRKEIDNSIKEEVLELIKNDPKLFAAKSTVLFNKKWHKGVIGIVAARCIEHFYRPTIILTASNGKVVGSARSIPEFNIYEAIEECADLLDQFGGHAYAAGLSLCFENVNKFQLKFEKVVADKIKENIFKPVQNIDLYLPLEYILTPFFDVLKQMAPWGPFNMQAVFYATNINAQDCLILKNKHLKFFLKHPITDEIIPCIGFNLSYLEYLVKDRNKFDMAYSIEENFHRNNYNIQLKIRDIKPSQVASKT